MKSVGILTMHSVINYGSFLQAYATQKVIEDLNCKCEIIDYKFPNKWHFEHGLVSHRSIKTIISDLVYVFGLTMRHRKRKKINQAIKTYLKLSNEFRSPAQISEKPPIYDVYVTGSDQTWNPKHTKGDPTFLLSFSPEESKRISFSASIAGKYLNEEYKADFTRLLSRYDNISIRDENGNYAINELIGKNVNITLDPTLVLTRKQWSEFSSNATPIFSGGQYIVFYLITHSFDPTPYIYDLLKALQIKTGLHVYSFSKIPDYFKIKHTICSDLSVEHFIQLFENASYVVTSSFHGTAFAANFGIPIYSVVNELNGSDDRQSSLLSKLKIKNCIVPNGKVFHDICPKYDVNMEQYELNELRKSSIEYLKDSL